MWPDRRLPWRWVDAGQYGLVRGERLSALLAYSIDIQRRAERLFATGCVHKVTTLYLEDLIAPGGADLLRETLRTATGAAARSSAPDARRIAGGDRIDTHAHQRKKRDAAHDEAQRQHCRECVQVRPPIYSSAADSPSGSIDTLRFAARTMVGRRVSRLHSHSFVCPWLVQGGFGVRRLW